MPNWETMAILGIMTHSQRQPEERENRMTTQRQLAPGLQPWLENFNRQMAALRAEGFKTTPTNAREGLANLTRALVTDIPDIAWCQDDVVTAHPFNVPVRIYHPEPDTALPVLVYLHGGGHMAGSVTVYDPICRKLARAARHIVVAADYRLAPECPYPDGLTDACNVVKHLWPALKARGLNFSQQLSLAGDSGGGALCASVAHRVQFDAGIAIQRQALIYPSLDYTLQWPSIEQNATGYLLERDRIAWYFDHYFPAGVNRRQASPLYMDSGARLPATLVITAEFCPLRDEGRAYVEKLRQAGIAAEHWHLDDMIHAFLNLEDLAKETCEAVYARMGRFLNSA
jgi:acetyl esterase/lipase